MVVDHVQSLLITLHHAEARKGMCNVQPLTKLHVQVQILQSWGRGPGHIGAHQVSELQVQIQLRSAPNTAASTRKADVSVGRRRESFAPSAVIAFCPTPALFHSFSCDLSRQTKGVMG